MTKKYEFQVMFLFGSSRRQANLSTVKKPCLQLTAPPITPQQML